MKKYAFWNNKGGVGKTFLAFEDDLKRLRNWTPASKHDDVPDSLAMLARHMFGINANPKILKR